MRPRQAVVPFLKLLVVDFGGLLKSLLKFTKEAYRKYQFKDKRIARVDLLDVIGSTDEQVRSYTYLDGTSRTIDIAFLKALCRKYSDCNYLEIGSWRGESLINVAEVAKKCTSISLSKQEMVQLGVSEEEAEVQGLFVGELENVRQIEANSRTFDFDGLNEKFDVIFIDGDHSYEGVRSDTEKAFRLLKNDDSVIVWHDCGFGMQDLRYESIMAIHDGCPDGQFEKVHRVSNTMCAIYSNQPLDNAHSTASSLPTKVFNLSIKSTSYRVSNEDS